MTKLSFGAENCQGATSGLSGKYYPADRNGIIDVSDPADIKYLRAGGYSVAGGMPRLRKWFICDNCGWEAAIRSCPHCRGESFTRVER